MKVLSLAVIIIFFLSYKTYSQKEILSVSKEKVDAVKVAYDLEVYDFEGFSELLHKLDDKVYVVNFWATWCGPCIKELPYFEKLQAEYKKNNIEVLLVSLDFPKQYESRLIPFIEKNTLKSKVVALNDTDSNTWIPKVSKDWSGALPATLIYNKTKRKFYEQSFSYDELKNEVKQFLN